MGEQLSALMQALYRGDREAAEALGRERELDVFEAAALGDVERLAELLDDDPALVGSWSPDGFTPLHYAVFFDGPAATRLLLERGSDLEAPAKNEEFAPQARPLHSAAAAGRLDVCEVLLEAGADPNARQHGGFTPLREAEQRDDPELAALLRRFGASS
jgi:ankyrin repeat protein